MMSNPAGMSPVCTMGGKTSHWNLYLKSRPVEITSEQCSVCDPHHLQSAARLQLCSADRRPCAMTRNSCAAIKFPWLRTRALEDRAGIMLLLLLLLQISQSGRKQQQAGPSSVGPKFSAPTGALLSPVTSLGLGVIVPLCPCELDPLSWSRAHDAS